MAGSVQVVDSPLLRQQVEAQRLGIKHLKNENNRLKVCWFGVGVVVLLYCAGCVDLRCVCVCVFPGREDESPAGLPASTLPT